MTRTNTSVNRPIRYTAMLILFFGGYVVGLNDSCRTAGLEWNTKTRTCVAIGTNEREAREEQKSREKDKVSQEKRD